MVEVKHCEATIYEGSDIGRSLPDSATRIIEQTLNITAYISNYIGCPSSSLYHLAIVPNPDNSLNFESGINWAL